jgi:hypothetical protein
MDGGPKTYGVGFVLIFPPPGPPNVDIVADLYISNRENNS